MIKALLKDVVQIMYYRKLEKQQIKQHGSVTEIVPYRATRIGFGTKL